MADEQVRFDVKVEIKSAINNLRAIAEGADNTADIIKKLSTYVVDGSVAWNSSWRGVLKTIQQVNAELAKSGNQTLLGRTGGQAKQIFSGVEKSLEDAVASGRIQTNANGVVTAVRNLNGQMEKLGPSTQKVGEATKRAAGEFEIWGNKINVVRTAFGSLLAVGIFQFLSLISEAFKGAIQQAREFEATLYRISNAERQLSSEGVEISVKGLKKGIEDIKSALPIFSKEDIAQLVGGVATSTKELGLNEEQVLKLSAAYAILNINSTETETLLQTAAKANNALISPQAKSIGNLGLSFGKAKMEAKALEMGILQTGQSFNDLTEKQKTLIKYQIILDTAGISNIKTLKELRDKIKEAGGDYEALNEYLESNDAKLSENSAAWKDLQTTMGQVILPFIPTLTYFFEILNGGFQVGKVLIIEFLTYLGTLGVMMTMVFSGQIDSIEKFTNVLKTSIETMREGFVNKFFNEVPEDAPEWFKSGWGDLIKEQSETATSGVG